MKYILAYGIGLMGVPPFRRNARAGHFITWKGLSTIQALVNQHTELRTVLEFQALKY